MSATPAFETGRPDRLFAVATPARSTCDPHAVALEQASLLRSISLGTRRGIAGVPPQRTRLNPAIGLASYAAARTLSPFRAECFSFDLLPWFDRWAMKQLVPGDHVVSSHGFINACFKFVKKHGGHTFVDAGNSHFDNFWAVISEEHRRWKHPQPPVSPRWRHRALAMMPDTDYITSPSTYVTKSFLAAGFKPEQILYLPYPVNLSLFQPTSTPRPVDRPLTIINTGSLSLRKGTPYLLEAYRIVRRTHPSARLLLTRIIQDDVKAVLAKYRDLPFEWSPPLPHAELAARLHSADVFVLPSLEEGLVRTALEAMACGLPAVLTPHCGSNDFIEPGVNGEVVPLRDPQAIAEAILKCYERMRAGQTFSVAGLHEKLSFKTFARTYLNWLVSLKLAPPAVAS